MSADKLATNIEKLAAKVEGLKRNFNQEHLQNEFESLRSSAVELLEEMADLVHEDAETEPEEEKDDE